MTMCGHVHDDVSLTVSMCLRMTACVLVLVYGRVSLYMAVCVVLHDSQYVSLYMTGCVLVHGRQRVSLFLYVTVKVCLCI